MLARVSLAALLLLTPASALQLKKLSKPTGDNFAYVSLLMWDKSMTKVDGFVPDPTKMADQGAVEESLNNNAALKSTEAEQALIPPGGHKMYGPKMIFKIDTQLREQGSKYPYIVITDDQRLIDSPELKDHPNLKLLKVGHDVDFVRVDRKVANRNRLHAQKLSVFNMTQYDKILSLDMDIEIKANLDHVFKDYDTKNGNLVYGMYNDFNCSNTKQHIGDYFNSAFMLLEPKPDTLTDMMEYVHQNGGFYGDQAIVQKFFHKHHQEPEIFPRDLADFVDCKHRMKEVEKKSGGSKHVEVVHLR